jgi:predicted RNA binding protein YcfA (HicA-like mRNA interferase family)
LEDKFKTIFKHGNSIPVHKNKDLKIGTLKALMKIAQLTEEDLI